MFKKVFLFLFIILSLFLVSCSNNIIIENKTEDILYKVKLDFLDELNYGYAEKSKLYYNVDNLKYIGTYNDGYVFVYYVNPDDLTYETTPLPYVETQIYYEKGDGNELVNTVSVKTNFYSDFFYYKDFVYLLNTASGKGLISQEDAYSIKNKVEKATNKEYKIDEDYTFVPIEMKQTKSHLDNLKVEVMNECNLDIGNITVNHIFGMKYLGEFNNGYLFENFGDFIGDNFYSSSPYPYYPESIFLGKKTYQGVELEYFIYSSFIYYKDGIIYQGFDNVFVEDNFSKDDFIEVKNRIDAYKYNTYVISDYPFEK